MNAIWIQSLALAAMLAPWSLAYGYPRPPSASKELAYDRGYNWPVYSGAARDYEGRGGVWYGDAPMRAAPIETFDTTTRQSFSYTPLPQYRPGDQAVIVRDQTPLMLGARSLGVLPQGAAVEVWQVRNGWLGARVFDGDRAVTGWIWSGATAPQTMQGYRGPSEAPTQRR